MAQKQKTTRRGFLRQGSTATMGALAFGALATSSRNPAQSARAATRRIGANDRLVFGVIGVGGMGGSHVNDLVKREEKENLDCAAVSDVYVRRAKDRANTCKGKPYADYRQLLDDKSIDAVIIATPDHWHFKNAMDAIDAGKQVYLQKPMVHSVEQALTLRKKVRDTGVVLQVGTQHTASRDHWAAYEAIKDGLVGHLLWTQASYSRNSRDGQWNYHIDPDAGPDGTGDAFIDWDMWLGHQWGCAPQIPWNKRHFFQFRKYWAYSGGVFTDLFYHKLAPLILATEGSNGGYPLRVSATGGLYVEKDDRDVPDTCIFCVDFPTEHSIVIASSMANDDNPPERIRGHHGTITLNEGSLYGALRDAERELRDKGKVGGAWAHVQDVMKEEFHAHAAGRDAFRLDTPAYWYPRRQDHVGNFIDVVRGKEKQLNCNVELGTATQIAITMGMLSYRQGQTLYWDAENERIKPA